MKLKYLYLIAPLALMNVSWADSPARPDLSGVWQLDVSQCVLHSHVPPELIWQIEQSDNAIHLVQRLGDKKNVDDLRCGTDGKDCKVKDAGHAAVINFYYNGPVLVELESQGQNRDTVTKKRLSLSQDGSVLTVDVIHVMPEGRPPEKLVLSRKSATNAK